MTPAELDAYLREQRRIIVVTIGPSGMPHPVPMNYGVDGDGRVLITTFAKSQKVRNLERNPRATLLVESGARYDELRSAMLYCDAELIREPEAIAEGMVLVRADVTMTASLNDRMDAQVRASLAKRVLVRFTAFRTVSWDHGKLAGFY